LKEFVWSKMGMHSMRKTRATWRQPSDQFLPVTAIITSMKTCVPDRCSPLRWSVCAQRTRRPAQPTSSASHAVRDSNGLYRRCAGSRREVSANKAPRVDHVMSRRSRYCSRSLPPEVSISVLAARPGARLVVKARRSIAGRRVQRWLRVIFRRGSPLESAVKTVRRSEGHVCSAGATRAGVPENGSSKANSPVVRGGDSDVIAPLARFAEFRVSRRPERVKSLHMTATALGYRSRKKLCTDRPPAWACRAAFPHAIVLARYGLWCRTIPILVHAS